MSSFDANAPPKNAGSRDLGQISGDALSRLEQTLTVTANSFHRWLTRGMAMVGHADLSPLSIMILNIAAQSPHPRTMADICLVLGVEDAHLARYATQKLAETGLIETGRVGKEKTITVTEKGAEIWQRFLAVRNRLLLDAVSPMAGKVDLMEVAAALRTLSGAYDQARRSAASW